MAFMGDHSASSAHQAAGAPLRRARTAAWIVTLVMGGTTMAFQVYHSVRFGHMPWELAALYGTVPLLLCMCVLEIVAEWRGAPGAAKAGAYAIMGAAMFLSASATGDVVLAAAPPHWSLLFGALLDGAELLAAYFIMNGPAAAQAVATVAQREAELRAEANAERSARQEAEANAARALAEMRAAAEASLAEIRAAHEANVRDLVRQAEAEREAAETTMREAAEQVRSQVTELEAQLAAAQADLGEAVSRNAVLEAKTERLTRKAAANGSRKNGANGSRTAPAAKVPNDVDARAEALRILDARPGISGAELGDLCGKSERWGQLRKKEFAGHVAEGGEVAES